MELVASPFEPAVLLIAAIDASDEVHIEPSVTFWTLPSENIAVATNCWEVPWMIVVFIGATLSALNVTGAEPPPPHAFKHETAKRIVASHELGLRLFLIIVSVVRAIVIFVHTEQYLTFYSGFAFPASKQNE